MRLIHVVPLIASYLVWSSPAAAAGTVTVSEQMVDFGSVLLGDMSSTKTITLTAGSDAGVMISAITTTDPSFVMDETTTARTLAPRGQTTFTLVFAPMVAGPISATINVHLQGMSEPAATIAVKGEGLSNGTVTGFTTLPGVKPGGCSMYGQHAPQFAALLLVSTVPLLLLRRRRRR